MVLSAYALAMRCPGQAERMVLCNGPWGGGGGLVQHPSQIRYRAMRCPVCHRLEHHRRCPVLYWHSLSDYGMAGTDIAETL
eukprot:3230815-Rhodomonas_salina.3